MGLFGFLFGNNSQSSTNAIDVEHEYMDILNAVECLAKAGAKFGKYEFFMYVQCQKERVVVNLKVGFRDHLQWLRRNPDCLPIELEQANLTESDYNFFMSTLKIRREDATHDVGEAMFYDDIKNRKHIPALYSALKKRLSAVPNTTHTFDESEYIITLHDD